MNELDGYDIEDLKAGMSATFAKTITEADIVLFASASGDKSKAFTACPALTRLAAIPPPILPRPINAIVLMVGWLPLKRAG